MTYLSLSMSMIFSFLNTVKETFGQDFGQENLSRFPIDVIPSLIRCFGNRETAVTE